jgi:hypothetical protein
MDVEAPFGKVEEAKINLLRASQQGDLEGIREAMLAGAQINTRLPMWLRGGSSPEDTEEDDFFSREDTFAETIETMGSENSLPMRGLTLTPLMYASYEGHVEAVKFLVSLRAQLDLCDTDGMQAIHLAAQGASAECCRVLLEAGANPAEKDEFGRDALQCVPFDQLSCHSSKREWTALLRIAGGEQTHEAAARAETSTEAMTLMSPSDKHCKEAKDATSNSLDHHLKKTSV